MKCQVNFERNQKKKRMQGVRQIGHEHASSS